MGEQRFDQRVLETWPCGCRAWRVEIVVGDIVAEEWIERFEGCREYQALVEREKRAELRTGAAYLEHGEGAPEHTRAVMAQEDIAGEIEEHHKNGVPTVEVLETRPG